MSVNKWTKNVAGSWDRAFVKYPLERFVENSSVEMLFPLLSRLSQHSATRNILMIPLQFSTRDYFLCWFVLCLHQPFVRKAGIH